jgi:hypothetical protein
MQELTLESLAKRIETLERRVALQTPSPTDWRCLIGLPEYEEFTKSMLAAEAAKSEAENPIIVEAKK